MFDQVDVINSYISGFESQLFTALPATVLSFDSEKQTVTARPVGLEAYTDSYSSEFPEIDHVPLMFPSGGGGSLTFPIVEGDEVLLVFSSRNFDTWWDTSETSSVSTTQRFHELTDAIAIVGISSRLNSTKASTEDVELKFKDTVVRLKADSTVEVETKETIAISNSSEELISLFSEILQEVSAITTPTIYGASPINNMSQILALKARLDTFKK